MVYGDSHAKYFFSAIKNVHLEWLGPVTMHRVGRDRAWFLKERVKFSCDLGIFVFGEIDVRCHIEKTSLALGSTIEALILDLAQRYISAISSISPFHRNVIVGVPPPADGPGLVNEKFPVFGTIQNRIRITKILNHRLAYESSKAGLLYLGIPTIFENSEGKLDPKISDGSVHVNPCYSWPIVKSLENLTGKKLIYDLPFPRKKNIFVNREFFFIKNRLWK